MFADALGKRAGRVAMAHAMEPSVWIQDHEDVKVYFTVDSLGELLVKFVEYLVEQVGEKGDD